MKARKIFLFIIAGVIALCESCKPEPEDPELVTLATVSASAEASQQSVMVICNRPWTASVNADWCTISPAQGQGSPENKDWRITISVETNLIAEERTAVISIQASELSRKVTLTQEGAVPELSISPTFFSADGKAHTYSITVTSTLPWEAAVTEAEKNNWCTLTPASGAGNGIITVSVTQNNYGYARRHVFITVTGGGIQRTDTIYQISDETYSDLLSMPVTIDGVTWASKNVDDFGRFTLFTTDIGKYYQFNRTVGYSYIDGNVVPALEAGYSNENSDWSLLNDPCPCGWRIPTSAELHDLRNSGYRWVNDPAGAWMGPNAQTASFHDEPGNALFFPAQGWIAGNTLLFPEGGVYWTKTHLAGFGGEYGYVLTFGSSSNLGERRHAFLVRCVKEE